VVRAGTQQQAANAGQQSKTMTERKQGRTKQFHGKRRK
jgi:hypothetical protein